MESEIVQTTVKPTFTGIPIDLTMFNIIDAISALHCLLHPSDCYMSNSSMTHPCSDRPSAKRSRGLKL